MHEVFAYLLLGIATNIDNMIIGTTYGLKRRRIDLVSNLIIATLNGSATFVSVLAGDYLRQFLSEQVGEFLGGLVFLVLGILTIVETYMMEPEKEPTDHQETISQWGLVRVPRREALALGLGLSVTNIAGGVGAGLAGFEALRMTMLMFVFSILPISLGQWVGQNTGRQFPQHWANIMAATVLTGVGLWKLMSGVMAS
ncbi:MAG: manganese efflux pump [Gloeomargarita sp. HHBFW_bins_162]